MLETINIRRKTMNKNNPVFGNFEEIQKTQSDFVSKFLNSGIELQKKQYELLTHIFQKQIEFGNSLLGGAMNILNDNANAAFKKEHKAK